VRNLLFAFASVERALLPAAFDFDFDVDREGHGFSRAAIRPQREPGFSR
jgi:hypothetical protein